MERLFNTVLALKERGLLPDAVMRALVRLMCGQWVKTFECGGDTAKQAFYKKKYFEKLRASAGALHQDDANIQHYEVPTRFFHLMLGPYLKYSCCEFADASTSLGSTSLAQAEAAMLHTFVEERLQLGALLKAKKSIRLLDLGCGWGSHGSYVLENYPGAHVTFLSNSATQQDYIKSKNAKHDGRFDCVKADASTFDDPEFRESFDVIFAGPPQWDDLWKTTVAAVDARPGVLADGGVLITQLDPSEDDGDPDLAVLARVDARTYGKTLLLFHEARPSG